MSFPPHEGTGLTVIGLTLGGVALSVASLSLLAYFLARWIGTRRRTPSEGSRKDPPPIAALLFAVAALPMGVIFLLAAATLAQETEEYARLTGDAIAAVEIIDLRGKASILDVLPSECHPIAVVRSREEIDAVIAALESAGPSRRGHESYFDGYLLRFVVKSGPTLHVSIFTESTTRGRVAMAQPHYDLHASGQLGSYSCPEALRWVEQIVSDEQLRVGESRAEDGSSDRP